LIGANVQVNIEDVNKATALHYAAVQGHQSVVVRLLQANADISKKDNNELTAVQHAATGGRLDVIKILLNKGANLEDCDKNGLLSSPSPFPSLYFPISPLILLLHPSRSHEHSSSPIFPPIPFSMYRFTPSGKLLPSFFLFYVEGKPPFIFHDRNINDFHVNLQLLWGNEFEMPVFFK